MTSVQILIIFGLIYLAIGYFFFEAFLNVMSTYKDFKNDKRAQELDVKLDAEDELILSTLLRLRKEEPIKFYGIALIVSLFWFPIIVSLLINWMVQKFKYN